MRHVPERLAARFLDGQMRRPERWRYERHLVECAECWTQVRQARAGRSAVESLRVVAPTRVRERVRAIPDLADDSVLRRRHLPTTPLLLAVAAVVVAVLVGVMTRDHGARAEDAMDDVAAAYRDAAAWAASPAAPPARALAGLRWTDTRVTAIDDDRVLGFRYTDGQGTSVLVVRRDGRFESPPDAEPVAGGDWVTEVDGITVFCTVPPDPYLVVGAEPDLVEMAARALTRDGS